MKIPLSSLCFSPLGYASLSIHDPNGNEVPIKVIYGQAYSKFNWKKHSLKTHVEDVGGIADGVVFVGDEERVHGVGEEVAVRHGGQAERH